MRRFLPSLAVRLSLLLLAGVPAALAVSATPAAAASCTSAAAATYRHTFDGPSGTATITAVRPLCAGQTQAFSIASYTTGALSSASGQFVYDSATAAITASKRTVSLDIAVPACFTQVDAFLGSSVRTETTSTDAPYRTATLGSTTGTGSRSTGTHAWYAGGSTACTATSTVSLTNACDGTFTAKLANAAGANASAVFLTGSRRIRLAPGTTTTLKAARNGTLTIRTSTYTTYVASWRKPATPCTVATAAHLAPTRAAKPAAPTRAATAQPTAAASRTAGSTAEPEAPPFYVSPSTPATDALADTGPGLASTLFKALGFLMIGGGVMVLRRLRRALSGTF